MRYKDPPLSLTTILSNLACIAENVRKDRDFCKDMAQQLNRHCRLGYHYIDNLCAKEVMKLFAFAVTEAIQDNQGVKSTRIASATYI